MPDDDEFGSSFPRPTDRRASYRLGDGRDGRDGRRRAATGATVVAGCLRNASAIASWLNGHGGTVTVIACGQRWPDGSLRPSLEDYLGAGAIIEVLDGSRSPEAAAAAEAWLTAASRVDDVVSSYASGKEVIARGWGRDLEFAVSVDAGKSVPVQQDGFVEADK